MDSIHTIFQLYLKRNIIGNFDTIDIYSLHCSENKPQET